MKKPKKGRKRRGKKNNRGKTNNRLYITVLAAAFLVSMGGSYFYFEQMFAFESSFIEDIESMNGRDKSFTANAGSSRLYETNHDSAGKGILRKDTLLVSAETIIREYFLVYKVRLLDLYMDKKGIIYIDIGDELKRNFKGDALEELSLIAGLYKKIRSTVPDFKALKILIEGREAESLGGHIDISKPIGEQIVESI
jgi:hypothetical protein